MTSPFDPHQVPNPAPTPVPHQHPTPASPWGPSWGATPTGIPAGGQIPGQAPFPAPISAPPKPKRSNAGLYTAIIVLTVALIGAVGVAVWQWPDSSGATPVDTPTQSVSPTASTSTQSSPPPATADGTWAVGLCGSKWDLFNDVVVTGLGLIMAIGNTGSFDGDFEGLIDKSELKGGTAGVIAMFSTEGEFLSMKVYPNQAFYTAALAKDGSVMVGGASLKNAQPDIAEITQFNSDGSFRQKVTFLYDEELRMKRITKIKVRSDDYVYAYGECVQDCTFLTQYSFDYDSQPTAKFDFLTVHDFDIAPDGSAYLVGTTETEDDDVVAVALKLSARGEIIWQKLLYAYGDWTFRSVAFNKSKIVIVGETTMSMQKDPDPPSGDLNALLLELDSTTGKPGMTKTYGGSANTLFTAVKVASDGSYIVTGSTQSKDGHFPALYGGGSKGYDAFVAEISSNGTPKWHEVFGGSDIDQLHSLDFADKGIVAAGFYHSTNGNLPRSCGDGDPLLVFVPRT